jgi:hypothetical protein
MLKLRQLFLNLILGCTTVGITPSWHLDAEIPSGGRPSHRFESLSRKMVNSLVGKRTSPPQFKIDSIADALAVLLSARYCLCQSFGFG